MTETTTARALIQAAADDEARDVAIATAIRDWLAAHKGEKLTKRNKPCLQAAAAAAAGLPTDEVLVAPYFGNLEVSARRHYATGGREGWVFRIGESACPVADPADFEARNPAVFAPQGAIHLRQPARQAMLATDLPEQVDQALAALHAAQETLRGLVRGLPEEQQLLALADKRIRWS